MQELTHHGVMGMKWGVRRYQPYGTAYDAEHKGKFVGERKRGTGDGSKDARVSAGLKNHAETIRKPANVKQLPRKQKNADQPKEVTVDLTGAKTKQEVHDRVKKSVNVPDHYGNNLDALNDVATEQGITKINIKGKDSLSGEMKDYADKMQKLSDDLQNDSKADKRSPEHKAEIDANEAARREELKKYVHGDQFDMNKLYDDANNNVKECEKAIDDISKFGTKSKAYQNSEYKQEIEDLCDEYEKYADIKIDENAKAEIMLEYLKYDLQDYKDLKDWANEGLADEDKVTPQKVMQQIHNKYNKKADEINKKYSVKHSDMRGWVMAEEEYNTMSYAIANPNELFHHGVKGQKWGVRRYQPYPEGHTGDGEYTGTKRQAKKAKKNAQKDAKEYARAKMYYGEGAGNRRKLIKATVAERSKDSVYKAWFDEYSKQQDMADHANKAQKERNRNDAIKTTKKTTGQVVRTIAGTAGTAAAVYTIAHQLGVDSKIKDALTTSISSASSKKSTARSAKEVADFLDKFKGFD